MTRSHVAITPGTGVLVCRESTVLFDPSGRNPQLITQFDQARDDRAAIRGLKQSLIDSSFLVAPLVMISWVARVELLAFGDCEVRSSAPSAPMISGASSSTWVEHIIELQDLARQPTTRIWSGDKADPITNLRLGTASCAGMAVTLTPEQVVAFSPPPLPTMPTQRPQLVDVTAASADPQAPVGLPSLMQPKTGLESPAGLVEPEADPIATDAFANDILSVGPPMSSAPNETSFVPGELAFPEGTVVPVEQPLVLGSEPTADDDGTLPITIHDPELAANHALISYDDSAVVLTDLGAPNGTFVTAPNAHLPTRLPPRSRHVLRAGTTVQLGASAATFVYRDRTVVAH